MIPWHAAKRRACSRVIRAPFRLIPLRLTPEISAPRRSAFWRLAAVKLALVRTASRNDAFLREDQPKSALTSLTLEKSNSSRHCERSWTKDQSPDSMWMQERLAPEKSLPTIRQASNLAPYRSA